MDPVALLRLVSQPTRHGILASLLQGDRPVGEIAAAVAQSRSNVSHHLRLLRDVGLVTVRREGRRQRYRIAHREVARLLRQVEEAAARLEETAYTKGLGVAAGEGFQGYG